MDGKLLSRMRAAPRVKSMPLVRAAAGVAADLVFPRRCPVCDRPVRPFGALVCPECAPMAEWVREPVCRRCGKSLQRWGSGIMPPEDPRACFTADRGALQRRDSGVMPPGEYTDLYGGAGGFLQDPGRETDGLCLDCRTYVHLFERGCAVFTYHSVAGGIFRFKYNGRREYGAWYGKCMAQRLLELTSAGRGRAAFPIPDMLVPVPLSRRRLEKRGYNQALILAREISEYTGIPVRADVLKRVAETPPLKKMSFSERQNNLKKAFQAFGNDVELKTIMLIDDIYTTGATIDACSDALYRQGARSVCFMALATGVDPV